MSEYEDRLNQTFTRISQAAGDPNGHTLTLHMWEGMVGTEHNIVSTESLAQRRQEAGTLFEVMSGDHRAQYKDTGYIDSQYTQRHQNGSTQGAVGVATTPMTTVTRMPVFYMRSNTGVLFLDAPPVYCGVSDAWSLYYDKKEHLPTEAEWRYMAQYSKDEPNKPSKLKGFKYLLDHPEERDAIVGKLAVMVHPQQHPVAQGQLTDTGKPYYLLDPLSGETQRKARVAYPKLIDAYKHASAKEREDWRYPEVCVNAKLEHAAAIVAVNYGTHAAIDPNIPISETLAKPESEYFLKTLYRALQEHEQLVEVMRKKGVHQTPTLVISQPWAPHPLIHCPPTAQLKEIVKCEMQKRGLLPEAQREKG